MTQVRILAGTAVLALAVSAAPAHAKKNKVQHTNVVAPTWQAEADPGLGTVTDLDEQDGVLYVAGMNGIAALDSSGAVQWKTELPFATVRNITVEDGIVAWSAFSVAGVDSAEGFKRFLMGSAGDNQTIADAAYGVVDAASGAATWTVQSDEQASMSPPGISPISIGVMRRNSFVALDRGTGAELGRYELKGAGMNGSFFGGIYDRAVRIQPVVFGDAFYTGLFSHLFKIDLNGNFVDKSWGNGLTPYVSITCGPVVYQDQVLFGSTGDSDYASMWFGVNAKMKGTAKMGSPDTSSGCSSAIVDDVGLLMVSNFYVVAIDKKLNFPWESRNKKGGLYPSELRGIRYVRGSAPTRKSYSDLAVSDGKRIYVATANGHDVLTVLDRASGAYLQTIDVNETLQALAPIDGKLAVATGTVVKYHPGVP